MKKILSVVTYLVLLLVIIGCQKNGNEIHVVATAKPHEEILIESIPLLKEKGYKLKITVITDYSLGNPAVSNNSADANFFQHIPYLDQYNKSVSENKRLVNVGGIHIEPIGLYGGLKNDIKDLADGDTIIISDNAPDYGRIVEFLRRINLVTVKENFNPLDNLSDPEEAIISKSKNFTFKIIEASLLVRSKQNKEGAFLFINGNYALEGGLTLDDILVSEPTDNNPYVNVIAVLNNRVNDEKIKTLVEVLKSEHIKNFINTKYNGSVISAN